MNTLLQRQLRKHYGDAGSVPTEWRPLIDAVDRAYDEFDDDRRKLERSIDLSSDELGKANTQLNERACELEAANQELEAFSYSVSHDLRAPLRHINGFVDLLTQQAAEKLNERERYYLRVVADSARQMGALIDDLLTFSRMSRTELFCMTVSTKLVVHEVVKSALQLEPKERRIVWTIGPLPDVEGDPAMLRQVWTNLIGNAMKYTRTRPTAEIEIGCDETAEGEVVFFVRDNGVGFDMQYADKLFGVFQRLHRTEDFEGTGIGLANVRRIISRQGGRTWADAHKDKGATFFFSLPKSPKGSKG
jgi:light-regulated signal transduction histidine kinase (bacteriophytochrome)